MDTHIFDLIPKYKANHNPQTKNVKIFRPIVFAASSVWYTTMKAFYRKPIGQCGYFLTLKLRTILTHSLFAECPFISSIYNCPYRLSNICQQTFQF